MGAIITIFLAGLAITSAAIVWLSLLVRKALLLVAIVFAPLALSGSSWDATRGWISKWAMFVVALICSKLVLVVMFLVAITQVAAPIDGDLSSISDPLAGVVLMAMAAFAPYLTYRFISFVGFDMYHAIGAEQDAKHALNRPIPLPDRQPGNPQQVLDGNNSGNGGGGKQPTKPSTPNPAASQGATESGAAESGAAGSGAASGGPAAAAAIGVQGAKDAATAGPKAGAELGEQAETAASQAVTPTNNEGDGTGGGSRTPPQQSTPTATTQPTPPPNTPSSQPPESFSPSGAEQLGTPSAPVPNPPPADNPPPPSSSGKEPQS